MIQFKLPIGIWLIAIIAWNIDVSDNARWFVTGMALADSRELLNAIGGWMTDSLWRAAKVFWAWACRDE